MNRLIKKTCLLIGAIVIAGTAGDYPYMPMDIGKPADYDETVKEFKSKVRTFSDLSSSLPASFDWRDNGKVTYAKDQGGCGSCWSFASTGALESKVLIAGGTVQDLAEQQQVSCNGMMWGCSGGSMSSLKFWQDRGPIAEACAPYQANESLCNEISNCKVKYYRVSGYYTVNMSDKSEIKMSLINDGPTYFRYDFYNDFYTFWGDSTSGSVYKNVPGFSRNGGHAVLIIGWDDAKQAWLCKNSWGTSDGPNQDGTFWIAYDGHNSNLDFGMANVKVELRHGDLNGDGYITSTDKLYLKNYLLGISTDLPVNEKYADLDGDNKITSTDYSYLIRFIQGYIDRFPAETIDWNE